MGNKSESASAKITHASPLATGGAGTNFEQHVGAYFLGLLLTKGIAPCFIDATISKVRFQTRNDEWNIDDLLVTVTTAAGALRNIALTVKLELTISAAESNSEGREVITGAWKDFKNPKLFREGLDLIGAVVSRGTSALLGDFGNLLRCAECVQTATEFEHRLNAEGYLSKKAKEQFDSIRSLVDEAEQGETPIERLWPFLRSLRILPFDFDAASGLTTVGLLNQLVALANKAPQIEAAQTTWNELIVIAGNQMPVAGSMTYKDFPIQLRERHRAIGVDDLRPVELMRQHSRPVLDRIRTTVGNGLHFKRTKQQARISHHFTKSNVVVVAGSAGCGKSALAKKYCEGQKHACEVFAFRAEEFATAHIDETFERAQIPYQATTFIKLLHSYDRKILLIESIERLLERPQRDAITDLLGLLADDPSWQIVMTCRAYSLDTVRAAFLPLVHHSVVHVPLISSSDVVAAAEKIEGLKALVKNQRIRELLRNPYLLDLTSRVSWADGATIPQGEKALQDELWKRVVKKDEVDVKGMPARRESTFQHLALRRATAMDAFVSCEGLDVEALCSLQADGLIEFSERSSQIAALSHDVLEDWAIARWIDARFLAHSKNHRPFLQELNTEPAIRRGYRHWLLTLVESEPNIVSEFVSKVLLDASVSQHVKDDTLVSLLRSSASGRALDYMREAIIDDPDVLLVQIIRLLRIACVSAPEWLTERNGVPVSVLLLPRGPAWENVLKIASEARSLLLPKNVDLVLGLIKDWSRLISVEDPYPPGAAYVGELLPSLLAHYEQSGYSARESIRLVVETILAIPKSCESTFKLLVGRACSGDNHDVAAEAFSEVMLREIGGWAASRDFPAEVIAVAEANWKPPAVTHPRYEDLYTGMDLGDVFGLSHEVEHGYSPASAWHGPFLPLLRNHPDHGMQFIISLLNHAVSCYSKDQTARIEKPYESEMFLNRRAMPKFCNPRLWNLYRGSSVGPCVLQSALMALEVWLLERCNRGEDVNADLQKILIESNNASLCAVVASIGVAFPEETGASTIPLLTSRDFVQLDLYRMVSDRTPISRFLESVFPSLPNSQIYDRERRNSDALPHRQSHLEHMAVRLQGTPLRDEVQRIIDGFYTSLPPIEDQSEADKTWRIALHRMDLRVYEYVGNTNDGHIVIRPQVPAQDLVQLSQEGDAERARVQHVLHRQVQAESLYSRDNKSSQSDDWRDLLTDAIAQSGNEHFDDPILIAARVNFSVFTATICTRDHWCDLDDVQKEWCISTLVSAASNESNDSEYGVSDTNRSEQAAAHVLPSLLKEDLDQEHIRRVVGAMIVAFTRQGYDVAKRTAEGIGVWLWESDPNLAARFAAVAVRRGGIAAEFRERNHSRPIWERPNFSEINHEAGLFVRNDFPNISPLDLRTLQMGLVDSDRAMETDLLVRIYGYPASGRAGEEYMRLLANSLAQTWRHREDSRGSDLHHGNYGLEATCRLQIGRVAMRCNPEDALHVCNPILECVENAPEHVGNFLQEVISIEDNSRADRTFWAIWSRAAEFTVNAGWLRFLRDDFSTGRGVIDALFLNCPWKSGIRHWEPLESEFHRIDELFQRLPLSEPTTEAYVSYLYNVGELSLPNGFKLLAEKLSGNAEAVSLDANARFQVESLLGRWVYGRPVEVKRDAGIREGVLYLLDVLIEQGSSSAYLIRDDFVTPLPGRSN